MNCADKPAIENQKCIGMERAPNQTQLTRLFVLLNMEFVWNMHFLESITQRKM